MMELLTKSIILDVCQNSEWLALSLLIFNLRALKLDLKLGLKPFYM